MSKTQEIATVEGQKLVSMVVMALAMTGKERVRKSKDGYLVKVFNMECLLEDEDFKKCVEIARQVNERALEDLAKLEKEIRLQAPRRGAAR